MQVDYEELKAFWDHLRNEHQLPDSCEVMEKLLKLWGKGCDEVVAWQEANMD